MKKIVKLTESDLYNIIRKTLSEDAPEPVPSNTEAGRAAKFLFDENETKFDPETTELAKKFLRDGIKSSIPTIRKFHNDPQFKMPPVVTFHVGTSSTGDFRTNKSVAEKRMSYLTDIYLDIMNSFGVRDDVAYKLLVQSNKSYTPSKIDRDFYDPSKVSPNDKERIATIVVRPITTQGKNIRDIGRISGGLIDAASIVNTWLYDNVDEKGILQGIKQLQTYSDIKDLDRTLIDARMGSLQRYLNRELSNYPEIKRQIVNHLNQIAKRSSKSAIANLVGDTLSIILENKKVVKLTESELVGLIQQVISEQETSPECQKIIRKIESHKSMGNRLISLVPRKYRDTFQQIFEMGMEDGPEAFRNAIPQEFKQKFEKVISTLKKPKTDAELESMISKIESDAQQIKEQFYGPSWLMPTIMIAGALFILVLLIIGLKNNAGEYCGQSVWWN